MRDLIVTAVTPNIATGRGVRTYGVTAALALHHDVEVAYKVFDWDEPCPEYKALRSVHNRPLQPSRTGSRAAAYARARARGVPPGLARGASPELAHAADHLSADVRIIADGPTVAAALMPLARKRPVVYLAHNLESAFRTEERAALTRFERRVLRVFAESWMATHADEEGAQKLAGAAIRTRYVPNVVDLDLIEPVSPSGQQRVVYVGDFTYAPNRDGLTFLSDHVLPIVWTRWPELRLSVVGRGLSDPPTDPRIETLGFVADLRTAYAGAGAVVVPLLHGGGSPLKFVEALAYGLPVIATSHATRLLEDAVAGRDFLSASDGPGFADALGSVIDDAELGRRLGTAARETVAAHYSVAALAARLGP